MSSRNIVNRGGEFLATFDCGAVLQTSTSLDTAVYVSAENTVALVATVTSYPVGTIKEIGNDGDTGLVVNLFLPSRRAISGGTVTAGNLLVQDAANGKFINAAGTLTANPVLAVAVTTGIDGEIIELIPVVGRSSVVIA